VGLALGAEKPRDLVIPGRELQGIYLAMDYLTDQNKLIANEISELKYSAQDKDVVIIGGGDTGSDCVGTALRQGARSVTQLEIMPRPPSERSSETPWPHWPLKLRTSHAHEEGGSRFWSVLTTRFEGDGTNVQRLVAEKVDYKNGKFEKVASEPELILKTDLVILALGFTGANLDGITSRSLDFTGGKIQTQGLGQTAMEGVFAAGDVSRGASLIVWAIAEGRKMAAGIDKYLENKLG
jgi:glutamate synthase (NADPH/NADH) small chain